MTKSQNNLLDLLEISLGKEVLSYLAKDTVTEITMNDDGTVWIDTLDKGWVLTDIRLEEEAVYSIIALVANSVNQEVTIQTPIVSAELPGSGFRFEGNIPGISSRSVFNIRKYSILNFILDDYVKANIMSENQKKVIEEAVKFHRNILVVGGTGSGKTTLCNAILSEIAKYEERIIIIQDTNELKCACPNRLFLRSNQYVSMRDLLTSTLRRTPRRIVIGEVRDGAALNVLKAWNTGHPGGLCTLHADSAELGLFQLEGYVSEVSQNSQRDTIARTVDLIVDLQKEGVGRKVRGIIQVEGLDDSGNYILKNIA